MILLAANLLLLAVIARSIDRFAAADRESRAARATRMLLWAAATVIVVQAGLGAVGLLTPLATFVALALIASAAWLLARRRAAPEPPVPEPISRLAISLLATLLAVFVFRS